jgi:hypothetical protein
VELLLNRHGDTRYICKYCYRSYTTKAERDKHLGDKTCRDPRVRIPAAGARKTFSKSQYHTLMRAPVQIAVAAAEHGEGTLPYEVGWVTATPGQGELTTPKSNTPSGFLDMLIAKAQHHVELLRGDFPDVPTLTREERAHFDACTTCEICKDATLPFTTQADLAKPPPEMDEGGRAAMAMRKALDEATDEAEAVLVDVREATASLHGNEELGPEDAEEDDASVNSNDACVEAEVSAVFGDEDASEDESEDASERSPERINSMRAPVAKLKSARVRGPRRDVLAQRAAEVAKALRKEHARIRAAIKDGAENKEELKAVLSRGVEAAKRVDEARSDVCKLQKSQRKATQDHADMMTDLDGRLKVPDHDHISGKMRYIVHKRCNAALWHKYRVAVPVQGGLDWVLRMLAEGLSDGRIPDRTCVQIRGGTLLDVKAIDLHIHVVNKDEAGKVILGKRVCTYMFSNMNNHIEDVPAYARMMRPEALLHLRKACAPDKAAFREAVTDNAIHPARAAARAADVWLDYCDRQFKETGVAPEWFSTAASANDAANYFGKHWEPQRPDHD